MLATSKLGLELELWLLSEVARLDSINKHHSILTSYHSWINTVLACTLSTFYYRLFTSMTDWLVAS